jgi:hypothetical protein
VMASALYAFPLSPPLCLCPLCLFFLLLYPKPCTYSEYSSAVLLTRLYTEPSIGELFSICWTPKAIYYLFDLFSDALTVYVSFPLSSFLFPLLGCEGRLLFFLSRQGPLARAQDLRHLLSGSDSNSHTHHTQTGTGRVAEKAHFRAFSSVEGGLE